MVSKVRAIEILSVLITHICSAGLYWVISGITLIQSDTPPTRGPTRVTVVARQFYWTFHYANGASTQYPNGTTGNYPEGLTIENVLYVNAGEVVESDVISLIVARGFLIYDLGVKIDAIPGHVNHYWLRADESGKYRIVCSQFCRTGHYSMTAQLIVV